MMTKGRARRPMADRLWERVDRSGGPDACWLHKGDTDNYGSISFFQDDDTMRVIGMHRAAYFLTHGILSDTLMILHRCPTGANKRCCNPAHLYLGTAKENADDLKQTGWSPGKRKLSNIEVLSIRELYGRYPQKDLATMFAITLTTVSEILLGHTYQDVGGPIKERDGKKKSHCHKGHPLTEDNVIYTHGAKQFRQCHICYMETNRVKARRRLAANRDLINEQRRARRGSTLRRFTEEECSVIRGLYPEHPYRTLAERFHTTSSTIMRIINGTYGGSRHTH